MPNLNVGLAVAMGGASSAHAIVSSLCMSAQDCTMQLTIGGGMCCCKQPMTGTTYTCPFGWSWNNTQSLCTRSSTSGTDSAGTYTQSYGTCSYTSSITYDCYLQSPNKTDYNGDACYCQSSQL
ncbi:MAG: hypothetical protein IKW09_01640 [Alphaproteobacteria bacterium]|nr:hypothetical protein [Alphaproteobacteria bacterium]